MPPTSGEKHMKIGHLTFLLSAAALMASACGTERRAEIAGIGAAARQTLVDGTHCFVYQLAFGEETGSNGQTAECIALRVKIQTRKAGLKANSSWQPVEATGAWGVLKTDHDAFVEQGCRWDTEGQPASCDGIKGKMRDDWESLRDTAAWRALTRKKTFVALMEDYERAKNLGCYNHPMCRSSAHNTENRPAPV